MTLGLLAIMLDEAAYVDRWLAAWQRVKDPFDRVVVVDGGSTDGTPERLRAAGVCVVERPLRNHFGDQRNFGAEQCETDWIFELDADEIPSMPLLGGLAAVVDDAIRADVDCVGIARLNFIDGVLVAGPGHKGLDYQYRLHNRRCHWRGAVHEEITDYRARYELTVADGHFIIHDKDAVRHAARNAYYKTIMP